MIFVLTYNNGKSKTWRENIIKDVGNLFRLEKLKKNGAFDTIIKNIRNFFRLEKEYKAIKDRIIIDIKNLFEHGNIRNIFRFIKN